jgi:F-type H+-transporting ATPase subunit b
MTAFISRNRYFFVLCVAVGLYLLTPETCMASDAGGWRPTYDTIMKWVNFFILVAIIVKYSRKPLVGFVTGKREEIRREIDDLDRKKEEIAEAVKEANTALEDSANRLEQLKQRIINQGELKKSKIIADAQQESEHIMAGAESKIQGAILQAHHKIRAEMIDRATDIALERLPREVTEQDNQKLMQQFLSSASGE